jgi:chromosome segregation ATPase
MKVKLSEAITKQTNVFRNTFNNIAPSSSAGTAKSGSLTGNTSALSRKVEEEKQILQSQYLNSFTGVDDKIQILEEALKNAKSETQKMEEQRDIRISQLFKAVEMLKNANIKLSDAEKVVNKIANSLKLKFESNTTPAEKIEAIGKTNKENLKALAGTFGMNAKDFESKDVAIIVENMKKNLNELVKNKDDTAEKVTEIQKNLKEANEKVETLTLEINEAKETIDELGKIIESMKFDFSNVEIPEAYIAKENPDAARLDAELKKLGIL